MLPASDNEKIVRELSTYRVDFNTGTEVHDHCLSCEALSYSWGSPTEMLGIALNRKKRLVTKALYSAFLHLQDSVATRVLRVDAVGINQYAKEERNNQVMQTVFLCRFTKLVAA